MNDPRYRIHRVVRQDRPEGTILLGSGYDLGPVANKTGDWLHKWAVQAPDRTFLSERSGAGWRGVSYAQALGMVRAIAASLLARGLGSDTPILIISGNGVDHGLLTLAAQYVGVPTVPVAEQYALIPAANGQLDHVVGLTRPRMVFAADGARFGRALALPVFDGLEKVVSCNLPDGATDFAELLAGAGDVDAAAAGVGPDSVVKLLLTSGSTSQPKAVMTTHRMMCVNQTMLADALPFLTARPPVIVDWLPWNHVFGGSHNFNMILANGGTLYIDEGKPVPALFPTSLENNRMKSGTVAFNVPVGYAMLRDAMKTDAALRNSYFRDLDMLFYAGASLPQDVWHDLQDMAREVRGDLPLFNSSWGLTETAPATLIQHQHTDMSGIVGVPMTGVTVKLIPDADMRCEVRVKGPNIMPGYYRDPARTAEAFDDEGFFITGDAMKFVDPGDMTKGLKFDGRMSEDFKLMSGTWVRAANLRLEILGVLGPLAQDVVLCGADRAELALMIFPGPAMPKGDDLDGALYSAEIARAVAAALARRGPQGSSGRIARALVLAEPPQMGDGEMTAKGNLNFRKVQIRRATLVDRLYAKADSATITL